MDRAGPSEHRPRNQQSPNQVDRAAHSRACCAYRPHTPVLCGIPPSTAMERPSAFNPHSCDHIHVVNAAYVLAVLWGTRRGRPPSHALTHADSAAAGQMCCGRNSPDAESQSTAVAYCKSRWGRLAKGKRKETQQSCCMASLLLSRPKQGPDLEECGPRAVHCGSTSQHYRGTFWPNRHSSVSNGVMPGCLSSGRGFGPNRRNATPA
jgi:hypothetical protein